MYTAIILVMISSYFWEITDILTNSSVWYVVLFGLLTVRLCVMVAVCIKGWLLSIKRDRFRNENPEHYYPDGYIYIVACWYVITTAVVLMAYRLCKDSSELIGVLGFAFLLTVVVFPLVFVMMNKSKYIRKYDPASKYFMLSNDNPTEQNDTPREGGAIG